MKMIACKKCKSEIDIEKAIKESPFCWPEMQTFWYECPSCKEGNHVRVEEGKVFIIEVTGTGPTWELMQSMEMDIRFRIDPSYLHIWVGEQHYEVEAKK